MAESNGSDRINVSRDTLRAELAELELRLMSRLDLRLESKAGVDAVLAVSERLRTLELADPVRIAKDAANLESRVSVLERTSAGDSAVWSVFKWVLPVLVTGAGIAAGYFVK